MKIRPLLLVLVVFLSAFSTLTAKTVTPEQARKVAANYVMERVASHQVDWSAGAVSLNLLNTISINDQPAIYVFTNNGTGFFLIAADDRMTPVLGYSYTGSFPEQGSAPNFESFLNEYIYQVDWIRNQPSYNDAEAQAQWLRYSSDNQDFSVAATTDVEPLMTCLWNQDYPYNALCPEDPDGPGGHVYAGCVATAMSMIMYYYRYPVQGIGTHSYYASGYGTQSVNYGQTYYNWDAMMNEISSTSGQSIPAIAELQYHAGVSVNMGYGNQSSGAYSIDVPAALISHFGYATSTQYLSRSSYTATVWENMVVEQLDAAKPVYYSGVDPTPVTGGGHAFIVDGYQVSGSSKMFHFNFGWSGSGNGYYTLANANGFTSQQGLIRNIVPSSSYPYGCSSRTITAARGSIEDGSSPRINYDPNQSCTYLIDPADSVSSISLKFIKFDVDPTDSLFIYDGADENAPLLGSYTGNSLPANISSTSDKVFLHFVTDGAAEAAGWEIEFKGDFPVFCAGTTTLTEGVGTFEDGSGPCNYNNNSVCRWKITPQYATDLTIYFTNFDLVEGDELLVYALGSSTTLLATLTGNEIPEPIISPTSGFLMIFKSNGYYQADGFEGYYTTSNVGIKNEAGLSAFTVSPNPAGTYTLLRFYSSESMNIGISLADLTGKTIHSEVLSVSQGSHEKSISLDGFKPGMYLLTLDTGKGKVSRKLIVQ